MKHDPKLNALAVKLHGGRIGVLDRFAGDRHLFSFERDSVDGANRATLSLSFKGQAGGLVTAIRPVGRRVPPFFSNLLPEGHLRIYLAEQAGMNPEREVFRAPVEITGMDQDIARRQNQPAMKAAGVANAYHAQGFPFFLSWLRGLVLAVISLEFPAFSGPCYKCFVLRKDMSMSEPKMYAVEEAIKAQKALRLAAGLGPEKFPIQAFVGMISDEVESLRKRGKTDEEIAAMIQQNSSIEITAQQIAENYASPEDRQQHGE